MSQVLRLRQAMAANGIDAVLLSDITSVQWISEFTGSFGYVLLTADQARFITDSRYAIQARQQVQDLEVVVFSSPRTGLDVLRDEILELKAGRVGFEPSISYGTFQAWTSKFEGIALESVGGLLTQLMKIKTEPEIARIRNACKLADACMTRALSMVQVGVSEIDIGIDIEFFFRRHGAKVGFEPIVASGPNSAKPHARPSERRIERGDFVTIDLGCTLNGYSSDITRTVVVGEATDRHREIYEQVLRAQVESASMLVAGSNGRDADAHARKVLAEKDLAQYFGHSLGHGLGRHVHDPGRLHESADEPIEVGQVWTVEPGVYIEGFGGVRIEDDVLVTPDGPEVLTQLDKSFTVV